MGSNVVRLIRSDHRKMLALLKRATGPHRNAEKLREELVAMTLAHVEATVQELLPYVAQRFDPDPMTMERHTDLLEDLAEAAGKLDAADDPDSSTLPSPLLAALSRLVKEHIELEDRQFLTPLDHGVDVMRLRRLGEMFRRRRDIQLRARAGVGGRLRRPDSSRAELYEKARRQGVEGRSKMTKSQLKDALQERRNS